MFFGYVFHFLFIVFFFFSFFPTVDSSSLPAPFFFYENIVPLFFVFLVVDLSPFLEIGEKFLLLVNRLFSFPSLRYSLL